MDRTRGSNYPLRKKLHYTLDELWYTFEPIKARQEIKIHFLISILIPFHHVHAISYTFRIMIFYRQSLTHFWEYQILYWIYFRVYQNCIKSESKQGWPAQKCNKVQPGYAQVNQCTCSTSECLWIHPDCRPIMEPVPK